MQDRAASGEPRRPGYFTQPVLVVDPGRHTGRTRRAVYNAALAIAIATTAAGLPAMACAPTPLEAATRFLEARASCDFIAAWAMLATSERAGLGSRAHWTTSQGVDAIEQLDCHARVEDVAIEREDQERITIGYVVAQPVVVAEFQRLHFDAEVAPILERRRLENALTDLRLRLLQQNTWEPRTRFAANTTSVREGDGWCIDEGYAASTERRRQHEQQQVAARERREEEQRQKDRMNAEAAARGAAALPSVSIDAVEVGQTMLREPGVFAEVVNRSRETLRHVEVRIDLLDRDGLVVAERRFAPLLHLSTRASDTPPLPPGQRRAFAYRVDMPPSTWARRARVVVERVEADPTVEPRDPPSPPARPAAPAGQRPRQPAPPR